MNPWVGAIYLDSGLEAVKEFIYRHLGPKITAVAAAERLGGLQVGVAVAAAQREFGQLPSYQLLEELGPDHSKLFKVAAQIGERAFTPAWGRSKKEAEQRAAENALRELAVRRSSSPEEKSRGSF